MYRVISITDDDNFDDDKYIKLLKLQEEINKELDYFHKNASPETIKKAKILKKRFDKKKESINNFHEMDENEKIKTIQKLDKSNTFLGMINNFMDNLKKNVDIDPGRLLGLTDGIFGMVMTLLIFGMALPEAQLLTAGDFSAFIQSITRTVGVTLVSFVLLSSFWIYHHEFVKIKSLNIPYLWLNISFLACISFIPFTTSIVGNYSQFFLANVIFGLNIFLTILSFLLMFSYANKRNFLEKKVTEEEKKYTYHTFYVIMGLTIVINLLDFNVSRNFIYLYFLVPIISTVRDISFRLKHNI